MEGAKEVAVPALPGALLPPDRFETERLRLRRPTPADAPDVFAYASDPEVTRYLLFPTHRSVGAAEEFLASVPAAAERGESHNWAITPAGSDRLIGMLGILPRPAMVELGYVLARPHWGKGYMVEALQPVVRWAWSQGAIHRVWAVCNVANRGSARVLEKLGMQREGTLRKWAVFPNIGPTPQDCHCYSIVRE